jgi:hypothetical protein
VGLRELSGTDRGRDGDFSGQAQTGRNFSESIGIARSREA